MTTKDIHPTWRNGPFWRLLLQREAEKARKRAWNRAYMAKKRRAA
jgi:hypothetical protein